MGSLQWTRLTRRRVLVILTLAGVLVGAWLWMDVQPAPIEIEVVSTRQSTPDRPPRTFIEAPVEARLDEPDADSAEPSPAISSRQLARWGADRWREETRSLLCDLRDAFPAADQFDRVELSFEPIDPASTEQPFFIGSSALVIDGVVASSIPAGPWQAVAELENAVQLRIRWDTVEVGEIARCTEVQVTEQLSGVYLTPTGEPLAGGTLKGCGQYRPLVDNEPIWIAIPSDPCTVAISMTRPGRLAVGPTMDVVPDSETDVEVFVPWPTSSDLRPMPPDMMALLQGKIDLHEKRCSGPDLNECPPFAQEFDVDALRDELAAAEAAWIEEEGSVPVWEPPEQE
jgi:hypothetical protein